MALSKLDTRCILTGMATAQAHFEQVFPEFDTDSLEELRKQDYKRLDELGQVYLDYTGGGLYSHHQLQAHMELLANGVYGNPHSSNPTSLAATHLNEHARDYVLHYFNADPDEYLVIFTQNASGALRLVGEAYPFAEGGQYLLTFDNHNSVNGIREFAQRRGATVTYAPVKPLDLRIDEEKLHAFLATANRGSHNLFAYPAQSNFSGVQHSLDWIEHAHAKGWDVLLDVAAFVPTNRLDLRAIHPDFVTLSFYKMFGYPTGIGALIARKDKIGKLERPWFAGGTITIASVVGRGHYMDSGEAGFEDGTIDYLNLPAVEIGLKHMESLGIERIHHRVMALTGWLLDNLLSLYHSNGKPLIRLYGPADLRMRGGTLAINFYDPSGKLFEYRFVQAEANKVNISLRTGCFCNPGAGEIAHGLTAEDIADCYGRDELMTFEEFIQVMSGRVDGAIGAVRVSVGLASNFADVYRFIEFAATFLDHHADEFATNT